MITSEWEEKKRNNIGGVVVMTEEEVVSFLLLFFFFKKLHSLHIHYHKLIFFLSFSDSPCVLLCLFCCSYDSYLSGVTCLAVQWSYITSTINYRLALSSTRYYKSKMKSFDTSSSWSDYSYVGQAPKWIYSHSAKFRCDSHGKN